jgi:hypothetical protein
MLSVRAPVDGSLQLSRFVAELRYLIDHYSVLELWMADWASSCSLPGQAGQVGLLSFKLADAQHRTPTSDLRQHLNCVFWSLVMILLCFLVPAILAVVVNSVICYVTAYLHLTCCF